MAPPAPLSRRQFLTSSAVAAAGVALLGACGGDGDDEPIAGDDSSSTSKPDDALSLIQFFGGPIFAAGTDVRAAFGLADADGLLGVDDTPAELVVQVKDPSGRPLGEPLTVLRHADGIPKPYYPLELVIDEPGFYSASVDYEGVAADMAFEVSAADQVALIKPGDAFPALETPTTANAQGVDPICTATPPCALHDVTAAQALAEGRPFAFLVATPAFCKITVCGPVLGVLVDVLAEHPEVRGLHAEVYVDPFKDQNVFAPAPLALKLVSEPVLVLVGSDGVVQKRIDTIFDKKELGDALASLS